MKTPDIDGYTTKAVKMSELAELDVIVTAFGYRSHVKSVTVKGVRIELVEGIELMAGKEVDLVATSSHDPGTLTIIRDTRIVEEKQS